MDLLFNGLISALSAWLFGSISEWLISMYEAVLVVQTNSFFEHEFVSGLLTFFEVVGGSLVVAGFVKRLIIDAEKQLHGDGCESVKDIFMDFLKAIGLLLLSRHVVLLMHSALMYVVDLVTANMAISKGNISVLMSSALMSSILNLIAMIVALVCSVIMLFAVLRRFAIMLIQIFTGYLYVFDVLGGGGAGIGEWARDVAGGCIAFALQLVFYKFGMMELANNITGGKGLFVAVSFLLGASIVPTVLKRWGYANQSGSGALGRFASTAAMMLPRLVG